MLIVDGEMECSGIAPSFYLCYAAEETSVRRRHLVGALWRYTVPSDFPLIM